MNQSVTIPVEVVQLLGKQTITIDMLQARVTQLESELAKRNSAVQTPAVNQPKPDSV